MMLEKNYFDQPCDLSSLGALEKCTVRLSASYIAVGRVIDENTLVVDVLDRSEMADVLRVQPIVDFEIEAAHGMRLCGTALVSLGVSHTGQSNQRFLQATLMLKEAALIAQEGHLRWLT